MAFHHRKLLFLHQPRQYLNLTSLIPCFHLHLPPPPPPPPPPQRDLSTLVSTSIYVLIAILLFLTLIIFLYLYITRSRKSSSSTVSPDNTIQQENDDVTEERDLSGDYHVWQITTVGLHRSTIDLITAVRFKKGEGIIDGRECSVCLNEFEEDESLRLLPKCSHAFHIDCIDTWLLSHKNCPLCRAPVFHTEPKPQETETNHLQDSGLSNDREEERSGSRNLSRAQSDLANHCDSESLQTVRRSFSIGGSSSLVKGYDGDDIANRSRRQFYTSLSSNFFSSSRRSRNQEQIIPN